MCLVLYFLTLNLSNLSTNISTISANLNSMAGIIYSDYIRPLNLFKHSDAAANLTMKLTIVTIGIYCVLGGLIVEQVESIFQVVNTIVGMTCGAVFGVFCLGMLYPRANHQVSCAIVSQLVKKFLFKDSFYVSLGCSLVDSYQYVNSLLDYYRFSDISKHWRSSLWTAGFSNWWMRR